MTWTPANTVAAVLALVIGLPTAFVFGWVVLFHLQTVLLGVLAVVVWRRMDRQSQ